ncbi:Clp protease, partial [Rhodococcus jostii]
GELREALSLPEDATPQDLFDAVLEKLTAPAPEPEPAASATLPDGVVAVEASVLDGLRIDAARGAQARAQQESDARENLVNAAIGDGRIPPARKQHWLGALEADHDGVAAALASLAPGLIPVSEVGHARVVDTVTDDAIYASLFGSEA